MTADSVTSSLNSWRSSTGMRLKNSVSSDSSSASSGRTTSPPSSVRGYRARTSFMSTPNPLAEASGITHQASSSAGIKHRRHGLTDDAKRVMLRLTQFPVQVRLQHPLGLLVLLQQIGEEVLRARVVELLVDHVE